MYKLEFDYSLGIVKSSKVNCKDKPDALSESSISIIEYSQSKYAVILYGGANDQIISNKVWIYKDYNWEIVNISNVNLIPRKGHSAVVVNEDILLKDNNDIFAYTNLKKPFSIIIYGGKSDIGYCNDILILQVNYMIQENMLYYKAFPLDNKYLIRALRLAI